jgi:hypothetical protein
MSVVLLSMSIANNICMDTAQQAIQAVSVGMKTIRLTIEATFF